MPLNKETKPSHKKSKEKKNKLKPYELLENNQPITYAQAKEKAPIEIP